LTETSEGRGEKPEPPPDTAFLPILLYVFGFFLALAALAFLAAWLWRRL